MIKSLLILGAGVFGGLWIAWPGISSKENWRCALEIALKSKEDKSDVRTFMAVSPKFLINRSNHGPFSKVRILGDTCFR